MLKFLLSILLIVSFYFIPAVTTTSLALDEGGCLTCHQYPGLVRLDESEKIKVLHIDEEKYLASPHGKFRCNKCHTTVTKVPHTGETSVDCTTECHKDDADKIASYPLSTLHEKEQAYILSLDDESSCRVCHSLYPHSNEQVVRAFLNMHTGFIFCEVCHIKRGKFEQLTYAWQGTESANFGGEPFGTYYNPQTGKAQKNGEHFLSRISAFEEKNGKNHSLVNTSDITEAKEFILKEKSLGPKEKEERLTYFHDDIERMKISVACNECHSTNTILDFNKLGFNERKTKELVYLNLKGLVTKYTIFHFPSLFNR